MVHRIVGQYKGRVSGWFNCQGVLTAAEQILPTFDKSGSPITREVKRYGPIWQHAQSCGAAYGVHCGAWCPG